MTNSRPLTALCKLHGITLTELADRICRPRNTVKKWGAEVEIPPERVMDIVSAFGGPVQPHDLRPDIYPAGYRPPPASLPTEGHAA
ncbi:MAG: transcriptional regulator [Alphaproteobacteria bacterium]